MCGLEFDSEVGKHLYDHIISPTGEVWGQSTSLTPPLFIEVPLPSRESGYLCVKGIDFVFGIIPEMFFFLHFINSQTNLRYTWI